ncbi:Predicted SnoaL-like aldol condensation-catalyzing enzyme [Marivirga sericea]|uniref:Predicted SnoaL-like aldol condensation-catalyzing enzyme n=1 Tax=Marivirga sericea TaxID=1028 RepID=A0A1X7LCT1_9BACT|nr:polyketide cyclase [Marivirga sericea]SMG51575.1 Predicted SnoaL-like aldol condensation-catalyzing enzyme [Marivirga sericea]
MQTEKQIATEFLMMVGKGKIKAAFEKFVGGSFKHHNPYFKGDAKSLMTAMLEDAQNNPEKELKILRALADGELVAVHSQVKQNQQDSGFVLVHIFKFSERKIVELWDIGQEIPAEIVNENGML